MFADLKMICTFAPPLKNKGTPRWSFGEVAEWSIAAVLKTVVLKGTRGSNPCLSGVFVLFKIIQPLHNKRVAILKESDEKRLIFIYPFSLIFQDFTSS